MSSNVLENCWEKVLRDTTTDAEALIALRRIQKTVTPTSREEIIGRVLGKLGTPSITAQDQDTPIVTWKRRISALETEVMEKEMEIDALVEDNKLLRSKIRAHEDNKRKAANANEDECSWTSFFALVVSRLQRQSDWQTQFHKQTGTTMAKLQQWRKANKVPPEAVQMAEKLTPVQAAYNRKGWTQRDYNRLAEVMALSTRPTYIEIASLLSAEFGREITENAIKGAVNRLREQGRLAA